MVVWLRQQIAEDRRVAEEAQGGCFHLDNCTGLGGDFYEVWDSRRVLDECDAKESILAWYESAYDDIGGIDYGYQGGSTSNNLPELLIALALPYAGRPGYREEWRS